MQNETYNLSELLRLKSLNFIFDSWKIWEFSECFWLFHSQIHNKSSSCSSTFPPQGSIKCVRRFFPFMRRVLSAAFEAILSRRAVSWGSSAPKDTQIHSPTRRKLRIKKVKAYGQVIVDALQSCYNTHTHTHTHTNTHTSLPKWLRNVQRFVLFIIIVHHNIMSWWVTSCEGASDRQILYSWGIQHKNVLTAFIGLRVFNCLKDQCKVLTLTRHVSVSITQNFVTQTRGQRQI